MSNNLIYKRWDGTITTERCYAIHWLKCKKEICYDSVYVYRDKSFSDDSLVEIWERFIPKGNNFWWGRIIEKDPNTNRILGSIWDKNQKMWLTGCMPATKEIKYLKHYIVEVQNEP